MAQIDNQTILSLCIPIYNRLPFLERQLARMLEDKDLFQNQIQLIISDNCSVEDLESCCNKYRNLGLNLLYHRNEINIGPDGNFDWCFHHADGKYVWLLGSDDVPVKGVLEEVLVLLNNSDYGLLHLSTICRSDKLRVYKNDKTILADINIWITFISSNIIKTESVRNFDLQEYVGSYLIQVPAYLNGCLRANTNALAWVGPLFEADSDGDNNGGYNLFKVFVENLFGMYQRFIDIGLLSHESFELIKKREYKTWLVGFVVDFIILKKSKRKNFDQTNAMSILCKHYGRYLYFYTATLNRLFHTVVLSVFRHICHLLRCKFS